MRTPNQRNRYAKLKGRLNKYSLAVQNIYDLLNVEAARIATGTGFVGGGVFRFSDYPMTADAVNKLQERFVREMRGLIYSGTSAEWKESNLVQDLLANDVLRSYGATIRGQKTQVYYQKNSDALRAFQERTERGMNLSTKLWNQSGNYKQELEYAISSAIEKGTSAVTLSKRLSKYLHDFPSLKADYKEKFGQAVTCQDCEYRSIRLARTEINMAYRTAEQKRWQQMDFVVGYEVKLSFSHEVTDICDSAQGKYPKDFVFMGWHPNCMCYTIPILKTEQEFWSEDTSAPSVNEVTDVPTGFKQWVQDNQERLAVAEQRGTLPYFWADNTNYSTPLLNALNELNLDVEGVYELSTEDRIFLNRTFNEINERTGIFPPTSYFSSNGKTDGTLMLWNGDCVQVSRARYILDDGSIFSPAEELLSAFRKIKTGTSLSFNEEYMIESLFHESVHASLGVVLNRLEIGTISERLLETTTQLYARAKYRIILDAFGVDAVNYSRIQTGGLGYQQECNALRRLFTKDGKLQLNEVFQYAKKEKNIISLINKMKSMGYSQSERKEVISALIHNLGKS